ncbi:MAG: cell division protein SepF [Propionibacteriaceae bacterium]|nr:cell division protein SepF [Propionibacteriaceae bacterium]
MAVSIKKAAMWLGLVSDTDYLDEPVEADDTEQVELADTPAATVTNIETKRSQPSPKRADLSRIARINPRTYNDARNVGEAFRDGTPVIMNLTEMTESDAKRLVDFSAGLIFGLHGNIERITSKVFLLSPPNIEVAAEDKERLAGGFYNQS